MREIRRSAEGQRVYQPDGKVLTAFLMDRSPVSIIRGPIGSGTSTAAMQKMWQISCEQEEHEGLRRTRWLVTRDSYPALETTTLATWLNWFPEDLYGPLKRGKPMIHTIKVGQVRTEVIFLALDDEDAIGKVRSLEITGAFFNELEFIDKTVFNEVLSRCGRYPPISMGGPTWYGAIADLNAPNEDHWFPQQMGDVPPPDELRMEDAGEYQRPQGWAYFIQPSALLEVKSEDGKTVKGYVPNPAAENAKWLPDDYYVNQIKGKSRAWIESRLMNRIAIFTEGRPVWPEFSLETHMAVEPLKPQPNHKVLVGLDFGRYPAAIFGQVIDDRWFIQHELCGEDVPTTVFAPKVAKFLKVTYPGHAVEMWGDPKGKDKGQNDDKTAYQVYVANGMTAMPAPVKQNNIQTRVDAVSTPLNEMRQGKPRVLISPTCRRLKVGMAGGYHYRKIQGTQRYSEEPEKNRYSHVCDALQYLFLGAGEGRAMTGAGGGGIGSRPVPVSTRVRHTRRRFG